MVKGSNVPGNMALLIFVSDSRNVFFYNKVIYNKILTFHGVLTHIKLQQFFHQVSLAEGNLLQTHVFADKVLELAAIRSSSE